MAITIQFDPQHCVQQPTLVLATRWGKKLGQLNTVQDFQMTDNMNAASQLSFNVYKYYNPVLPGEDSSGEIYCQLWDDIVDFKLLWVKEWDKWFSLQVAINEQDATVKNVVGTSLAEAQLSQIMLYNIEINTETDILRDDYVQPTILYDPDDPSRSLLNRIMQKAPHYSISHVDYWIRTIQRTFTFDGISLYDAFQEIAQEIGCVFIFDSASDSDDNIARTIAVYDLQSYCIDCGNRGDFYDTCPECGSDNISRGYGEDTTIFISTDALADSVTYETNVDAVKNCFRMQAGDDLMTSTIMNANSNGSAYIWYITDDMKKDMPDQLVERINSYDVLYNQYQTTKQIDVSSDVLDEYNAIVAKYYAKDPDQLANKTIESPIISYPNLSEKLYEVLDCYYYIKTVMMPSSQTASTNAELEAAKLTAEALDPVAVADVSNITLTTANSAVLAVAKAIVDYRYQVKVNESELNRQTWTGNFTVSSYYDSDDTATSETITIEINDDYEIYLEQLLEKTLANNSSDAVNASDLFQLDLDDFTAELGGYCLDELDALDNICQSCMDILIEMGIADRQAYLDAEPNLYETVYYPYYEKKQALEAAIAEREEELYIIDSMQELLESVRGDIQEILDFEGYLGQDLWLIFCAYKRQDTYSNDNYISDGLNNAELFSRALQFIDVASEQLYKSAELQHSISATLWNLLSIPEFEPLVDYFSVGNWLRIRVDNQIYRLRMTGYTIIYDNIESITVTFSDVTKSLSGTSDASSVLSQASIMASSYGAVSHQASNGNSSYDVITGWSIAGLDVTNTKIIAAADGQTQTWDQHGFLLRRYDSITDKYDNEQMKIVNSTIAITDDAWKTVRTAIGRFYYKDPSTGQMKQAYGVNGEVLVGNLILGESLGIYTADGSMTFDENGLTIDTSTGNAFTIKNGDDVQFYIDADGNVVLDNGVKLMWGNIDLADLILSSGNIITVDDDGNTIYDEDGNPMSIYKYIGAEYAYIENLTVDMINALYGEFETLVADYIEADSGYIIDLITDTITTQYIMAEIADVGFLTADSATIVDLTAFAENVYTLLGGTGSFGELETIHLTSDNAVIDEAVIVTALMDTVLASVLTAGVIYTDYIQIANNEGKQLWIDGSTIQLTDNNEIVRVQIGEDASGDYNLYLWNADGELIWDAQGLCEAGLPVGNDAIIRDAAVADDANISGYKLNIEEICSIINTSEGVYTIEAASVTIDGQGLDAWYTQINEAVEGLEGLTQEGLTGYTRYYCYWGSATEAPPDDEDVTPAICGEAICGLTICGLTEGNLWQEEPIYAIEGVYRWCKLLGTYQDGHTEWGLPYCMDDGYAREQTQVLQTQLTVVQGLIDAKVWETDIESYVDPLYGYVETIEDQYAELTITVSGIYGEVGDLQTIVEYNYQEFDSRITSISADLDGISMSVSDVQQSIETIGTSMEEIEKQLENIEGVTDMQPYWCLWDSGEEAPPDNDDLTPAICGEAVCGLTICGVTDGQLWTTTEPVTQDGLYEWVKYELTFIDGHTEWRGPYCLTDVYARSQISSVWSSIDILDDRITEEVGNVQSIIDGDYEYLSSRIADIEVESDSISLRVSAAEGDINDLQTATGSLEVAIYETQTDIISYINASADVISLKGERIIIDSPNFKLSADGTIEATGGTFYGDVYANNLTVSNNVWTLTADQDGFNISLNTDDSTMTTYIDLFFTTGISLGSQNGVDIWGGDLNITSSYVYIHSRTNIFDPLEAYNGISIHEGCSIIGDTSMFGDLYTTGDVMIDDTLDVFGATNIRSTLTTSGNIMCNSNYIYIGNDDIASEIQLRVRSMTGTLDCQVTTTGNMGLYDVTSSKYIIYENSSGKVRFGYLDSSGDAGTSNLYWSAGDSFSISMYTAGFVSNGRTGVYFTIPTTRPIVGSPTISISGGISVRQDGNYLFGSSSGAYASFTNSMVDTKVGTYFGIRVRITFSADSSATNNDACGITLNSVTVSFS